MKKGRLILLCLVLVLGFYWYVTNEMDTWARIDGVLDAAKLTKTSSSYCVYDNDPHAAGQGRGMAEESVLYEMIGYVREQGVNPVSAFLALYDRGLFTGSKESRDGLLIEQYDALENPRELEWNQDWELREYEYSADGAAELLEDAVKLSGAIGSNSGLERKLLDVEGRLNGCVYDSRSEDCLYSYHIEYSDAGAAVLCCYFRSGDGRTISDVEFQLMLCEYITDSQWAGSSYFFRGLQIDRRQQFAALATAMDHIMAGHCGDRERREDDYGSLVQIPESYTIGERSVTAGVRTYQGEANEAGETETVELYHYRIR